MRGTSNHSVNAARIRSLAICARTVALTTVLADGLSTALLAPIALTTVLADSRPTALLAPRAPTTVLACFVNTLTLAQVRFGGPARLLLHEKPQHEQL